MSDKKYRLQGGAANHYHDGEPVGDEPFVPTDSEHQILGDLLVPVHGDQDGDGDTASSDGGNEDEAAKAVSFVQENNAPGIADAIADGEADGHLAAVRKAENDYNDSGGRKTVHNALDERAEETGEDAGERADESEE